MIFMDIEDFRFSEKAFVIVLKKINNKCNS